MLGLPRVAERKCNNIAFGIIIQICQRPRAKIMDPFHRMQTRITLKEDHKRCENLVIVMEISLEKGFQIFLWAAFKRGDTYANVPREYVRRNNSVNGCCMKRLVNRTIDEDNSIIALSLITANVMNDSTNTRATKYYIPRAVVNIVT